MISVTLGEAKYSLPRYIALRCVHVLVGVILQHHPDLKLGRNQVLYKTLVQVVTSYLNTLIRANFSLSQKENQFFTDLVARTVKELSFNEVQLKSPGALVRLCKTSVSGNQLLIFQSLRNVTKMSPNMGDLWIALYVPVLLFILNTTFVSQLKTIITSPNNPQLLEEINTLISSVYIILGEEANVAPLKGYKFLQTRRNQPGGQG